MNKQDDIKFKEEVRKGFQLLQLDYDSASPDKLNSDFKTPFKIYSAYKSTKIFQNNCSVIPEIK